MVGSAVLALAALLAAPALAAPAVPRVTLSHTGSNAVSFPRVMLGTGGGGGGYNVSSWLAAGGTGMDSAYTYCYNTAAPFCSHAAISFALLQQPQYASTVQIISKIEPETFGSQLDIGSFGMVVSRGILQDLSMASIDQVMFHQAGRGQGNNNPRPPCFNASGATDGTGTYAGCRVQTFAALQAMVKAGSFKSIGVSNWHQRELQQVYDALGVWPSTLEIEVHPYWHEDAVLDFAISKNITIVNYAPLAVGSKQLLSDPAVLAVAAAHGVSPATACLLWGAQRTGGILIPRSSNPAHQAENLAALSLGVTLSPAEMASLSSLPQKKIFNVYCDPWC